MAGVTLWPQAHTDRLRELLDGGATSSGAAKALNAEFGTAYTRNAIIGRADRMRGRAVFKPKRKAAPMPGFDVEIPVGRTPVRFVDTGGYVCRTFLPGEPVGPYGMVCGNPVDPASDFMMCTACKRRNFQRNSLPISKRPTTFRVIQGRAVA